MVEASVWIIYMENNNRYLVEFRPDEVDKLKEALDDVDEVGLYQVSEDLCINLEKVVSMEKLARNPSGRLFAIIR